MMLVKGNLDRRNFKDNIGSWFLPCLYNFLSLYHLFVYFLLSLLEQITNSYHCEPSSWKELLSASFWVGFSFLTYVQLLKHCWNKRPEDGGKDARQECGEWKRSCLQGFEGGLSTHTRMYLHTHTCIHTHASTHKCTQVCFHICVPVLYAYELCYSVFRRVGKCQKHVFISHYTSLLRIKDLTSLSSIFIITQCVL